MQRAKIYNRLPRALHLLGAPTPFGFAHVRGWLDLWHEFENDVADTDDADNCTGDVTEDLRA
jgi:hypothetical protein